MIQTSQKWKDYAQDGSIFHINAVVGNQTLTDADFMEGSLRFTDAVSGNSEITLGSVITNSFSATLNNTTGKFNNFNWNQELTLKFYPDYTPVEMIQRGIYRLEKPRTTGNTIQITGYDRMDLTNKYYIEVIGNPQTPITFPIKARALVEGLCAYCGVPFGSWNLANPDIEKFEYDESCTCRQVIAWTLQTLGGYARINNLGRMDCKPVAVIGWEVLENYEGGVFQTWNQPSSISGGTIQPWTAVANVDGGRISVSDALSLYKIKQTSVGMDDIEITGIRAYKYNTVDEFEFDTAGSDGYILGLSDNPLITDTAAVANRVWESVKGFKMRPFNCTTFGDPSIEAGDAVVVQDYLGNLYQSVVTNINYSIGDQRLSFECASQEANALETANPTTQIIKGATYAAYDYLLAKKITADVLNAGVLKSRESETNPNFYLNLTDGVLRMNATELNISAKPIANYVDERAEDVADDAVSDYDTALNQQKVFNKLTNNLANQGIYLLNGQLYVNASMMATGILQSQESNNPKFYLNLNNGTLKMDASELSISTTPINTYVNNRASNAASSAVSTYDSNLNQQAVFNKLTNNQANQGIYLSNGQLYINASMINTGTLSADRVGAGSFTMTGGTINVTSDSSSTNIIKVKYDDNEALIRGPLMGIYTERNSYSSIHPNVYANFVHLGTAVDVVASNVTAGTSAVLSSNGTLKLNGSTMAEFVTSQGLDEDTGWNFRIWNSGRKECWQTVSVQNLKITNNWNNHGCNSNAMQTDNYPFTFASIPNVQVTAQIPGGYGWAMVGSALSSSKPYTKNVGYFYAVSLESIETSGTSYFHFYVWS